MNAQELIEGLKKGVRYRTEHGEFTKLENATYVRYRGVLFNNKELDVILSEIGDRLIVEEPKPKVKVFEIAWRRACSDPDYMVSYPAIYCTPDMVPLVEKAVRELGGLE